MTTGGPDKLTASTLAATLELSPSGSVKSLTMVKLYAPSGAFSATSTRKANVPVVSVTLPGTMVTYGLFDSTREQGAPPHRPWGARRLGSVAIVIATSRAPWAATKVAAGDATTGTMLRTKLTLADSPVFTSTGSAAQRSGLSSWYSNA